MFSSSLIRFIFRRRKLLLLIIIIFCCLFIYAVQIHHRFDDLGLRRSDGSNSSLLSLSSHSSSNDTYNGSPADIQGRLVACIGFFLKRYTAYCSAHVRPRYRPLNETNDSQLCPCIPNNLVGFFPINETEVASLEELESAAAAEEEEDGGTMEEKVEEKGGTSSSWRENGRWRPSWCVARQRVAIIVPYADRERHLRIFLRHMHPLLQRQLIDYNIFIIEQLYPELFNRAALMNVGFVEARRNWTTMNDDDDDDDDKSSSCSRCNRRPFDCFIFHDIDQLPIDDRNFYVCSEFPRHVVGYRKKFNYGYAYSTSFGGGNSFREEEFQLINGFSNIFYGWGGEDDDLYQRTVAMNMSRTRYPRCIARYDEVTHARDKRNPRGVNQHLGFKLRPEAYRQDGLTNLNYTVESIQRSRLFTKISVRLPPPPPPPDSSKGHGWLNLIRLMLGIQEDNLYEENL